MKLLELPKDASVAEALNIANDQVDNFEQIIILAIDKEGSQHIILSNCSMMERSFLYQFFGAYLNKWFFTGDL